MNKKNDYIQIILEFSNDTIYRPSDITNYLLKKFPELGNELILPLSEPNNKEVPIFVFQQNPNFSIFGNFFDVTITVCNNYRDRIKIILQEIFNAFKDNAIFYAIAFTFEQKLDTSKIELFKKNYFKNGTVPKNEKFHFVLSRNINIDNKDVLCVEGYSTINDNFTSHFEFHFKRSSYKSLSYQKVLELYDSSVEYKNNKIFT